MNVQLRSEYDPSYSEKVIEVAVEEFPFKIGRISDLGPGSPFANNDLFINDRVPWNVSRNHCAIERRGNQIVVQDRGSKLGTVVNGRPIGVRFTKIVTELNPGKNELVLGGKGSPHKFSVTVS